MHVLTTKVGLRPLGSPGWTAAREYLKSVIGGYGFKPTVIPHRVDLFSPLRSNLEILGSSSYSVACLGAVGSPSASIQGPVRLAGQVVSASPEGEPPVLLIALGERPAWEEVQRAADKGPAAVLLFDPEHASLRAMVAARSVAPMPVASIRRADAWRLIRDIPTVRLSVVTDRRPIECESLAVRVGHGPPRLLFLANYDTWPKGLGPVGGAVGVAVVLGLLGRLRSWKEPAILFALLDAEVVGGHGSQVISEWMEREGILPGLRLVVDVTKLGFPGRLLVTWTGGPWSTAARGAASIREFLEAVGYESALRAARGRFGSPMIKGGLLAPVVRLSGRGLSPADVALASCLEEAFSCLLGPGLPAGG